MTDSRVLLAISVLQTALIAFLAFKVSAADSRIEGLTEAVAAMRGDALPHESANASLQSATSREPLLAGDVQQLRDEIGALRVDMLAAIQDAQLAAPAQNVSAPPPLDASALAAARAEYENELSAYIARGRISEDEMGDLMGRIARLPPSERARALGEVSRAINRHGLDAQF